MYGCGKISHINGLPGLIPMAIGAHPDGIGTHISNLNPIFTA
jgi:hypothetical protein